MKYTARSSSYEDFLTDLNDSLAPRFPSTPVGEPLHLSGQIVGLPRSGTTILYQLLARTRTIGYPSNVMAPFWRVPVVGARLQRKLAESEPTISMRSVAGRTSEPLDPHEFGYFWREALGHSANTLHPDSAGWGWDRVQSTLDAITEAFDAPTVYKNFLALGHAEEMRAQLPRNRFIVIRRDPRDVAASLWSVRQKIGVPSEATFGLDPGGDQGLTLVQRIVDQVTTLEKSRAHLVDSARAVTLVVDYEELCNGPKGIVNSVLDHIEADVDRASVDAAVPDSLPAGQGQSSLPSEIRNEINASGLEAK